MSTQGVLILKKNGLSKGIRISHDAYPDSAGQDIVDLIKTIDLSQLLDLMIEYDEMVIPDEKDEPYLKEPEPFSYDACRLVVKNRIRLCVSPTAPEYIKNSLFCEYGYVIDLDFQELLLFVGNQTMPQPGNPYGEEPIQSFGMTAAYYPCRLIAIYPIQYVKNANIEFLIKTMATATKHPKEGPLRFRVEDISSETAVQESYQEELDGMRMEIKEMEKRLHKADRMLSDIHPVCMNRIRELTSKCIDIKDAVHNLEKKIESIR